MNSIIELGKGVGLGWILFELFYGCNSAWHKHWGSGSAPSLKGY